ncbi:MULTISPECIES: 3-methyl-2-oxobutanoate hydroxymethyltransferase [Acidianus]|uniref:3-methyl-2-oxobutanoate hydroxymethyltransferase n=1 Tax=Candidatus Acidianus copahuensis TaxID=1160895 RepID=A0A031LR02_9CREN|nr:MULTISPECIES: 3-methyl-2-oxobutanoate hydroxymethyltransferase [Acidianus]EZQ10812.1 3-methyl-2-oxobutanoate hydroxymethyltransferase [Candidatus Acidianus copahuensis]NON62869.1 3-methyl-2-oxobutanoate hydroxymethyltransferase [Acidianus sp. RZ1]
MSSPIRDFIKKKGKEKIVMLTVYDFSMAKILSRSDLDAVLVGDSLGMNVLGYPTTLQVTMTDMVSHVRAVARAGIKQLIVADMPFMSYEQSVEKAIYNAGKMAREGAHAVKLEGGSEIEEKVSKIVEAGIPVMGHIGLTPQRVLRIGGYRIMKDEDKLVSDAKALEDAGAFSIVIENTLSHIAKKITDTIKIPTICIGSGPHCDGQVLVIHDVLGLGEFIPYFAKPYLNLKEQILSAVKSFTEDVKTGKFPFKENYKE